MIMAKSMVKGIYNEEYYYTYFPLYIFIFNSYFIITKAKYIVCMYIYIYTYILLYSVTLKDIF